MGVTFKLNQADLNRIKDKLNKTATAATSEQSALYKYKFSILDEYRKAVVSVMGVVDAAGGTATSKELLKSNFSVSWGGLSFITLIKKHRMGWNLNIWEASGETKKAVKVKGNFAGIDGSTDPAAYAKALEVEFGNGGEYEERALFTIANYVVMKNMDEIKARIKRGFIKTAIDNGWGR